MESGTSFFNPTLYKNALRRFWPGSLALAVVWAVQMLRPVTQVSGWGYEPVNLVVVSLQSYLPAAAACLAAMAVYRWLHQSRAAAFMAALPVRREAAFLSHMAAGLTLLLAGLALAGAVALALGSAHAGVLRALWCYLGITALLLVCYFGLASLCAVLVGHTLALPALYAILLYAAVAVEASVRRIAQFLIFGLSGQRWRLVPLSPVYHLRNMAVMWIDYEYIPGEMSPTGQGMTSFSRFTGWPPLANYAIVGAALALLAVLLLRRRGAESAGDVVALPGLRRLFPWCAALAATLTVGLVALEAVFGFTGYESASSSLVRVLALLFLMLLGGFVGWFGARMLLEKTLRVFDRGWIGWGVAAAVTAALVLGARMDVLGVERRQPAPARVGSVQVTCWMANVNGLSLREPENIQAVMALQNAVLDNKDLFAADAASTGGYGGELSIDYYDRNGALLLHRSYSAPAGRCAWSSAGNAWYYASSGDSYASGGDAWTPVAWGSENPALALLEEINNSPEAVRQRMEPPEGYRDIGPGNCYGGYVYYRYADGSQEVLCEMTGSEGYALYEKALLPDSRDGSLGQMRLRPLAPGERDRHARIYLSFHTTYGGEDYYWWGLNVVNTADSVRTNTWLETHGVHLEDDGSVSYWDPAYGE